MPWTFNASGIGGFPAIAPKSDAALADAAVNTSTGPAESDKLSYRFPELNGAGSLAFGQRTEGIRAVIQARVTTPANRQTFEGKLRRYLGTGRRFVLVTERGEIRSYVELRSFRHREGSPFLLRGGAGWYCVWEVELEDMQPWSGA